MRHQLRLVHRVELVFGLALHDHQALNKQIRSKATVDLDLLVYHGTGCSRSTRNPLFSSSYARQARYADSRSPGPRTRWTLIAAPIIADVRSLSFIVRAFLTAENAENAERLM